MIDPARRDTAGRKTVLIEDCTPDVCSLQASLRRHALHTIIKLSPMLDIKAALRALSGVSEVHVVGAEGECKELLIVMQEHSATALADIPIYCSEGRQSMQFTFASEAALPLPLADGLDTYIYEPSAAILKGGAFRTLCSLYTDLWKLAPDTHLYTSPTLFADFPGRIWCLISHCSFSKPDLRTMLAGISAAELTTRGFPMSVAVLRRQLRLREGGTAHFIATTLADGSRQLLKVTRIE